MMILLWRKRVGRVLLMAVACARRTRRAFVYLWIILCCGRMLLCDPPSINNASAVDFRRKPQASWEESCFISVRLHLLRFLRWNHSWASIHAWLIRSCMLFGFAFSAWDILFGQKISFPSLHRRIWYVLYLAVTLKPLHANRNLRIVPLSAMMDGFVDVVDACMVLN